MTNQFGNRNRQFGNENSEPDDSMPTGAGQTRKPRIRPRVKRSTRENIQADNNYDEGFQAREEDDSFEEDGIDPKKRSIALVFDILISFCIGLLASVFTSLIHLALRAVLPGIALLLSKNVFIVAYFMLRDSLYQGRGFGKNFMGLRVIDVKTGEGPSLLQSVKRNLIFILPFLLQFIVQIASQFIPSNDIRIFLSNITGVVCTLYVIILLPLECYQAMFSPEGRRFGDRFAGTKVVESELDFSRLFN